MSKQFRKTFREMILRRKLKRTELSGVSKLKVNHEHKSSKSSLNNKKKNKKSNNHSNAKQQNPSTKFQENKSTPVVFTTSKC